MGNTLELNCLCQCCHRNVFETGRNAERSDLQLGGLNWIKTKENCCWTLTNFSRSVVIFLSNNVATLSIPSATILTTNAAKVFTFMIRVYKWYFQRTIRTHPGPTRIENPGDKFLIHLRTVLPSWIFTLIENKLLLHTFQKLFTDWQHIGEWVK